MIEREQLYRKIFANANEQTNEICRNNYLNSLLAHGGDLAAIAQEIVNHFEQTLDFSI